MLNVAEIIDAVGSVLVVVLQWSSFEWIKRIAPVETALPEARGKQAELSS
jgi:hypothetical protein